MSPLIFVVGPTGVGKSGWAMDFVRQNSGVILNCDSVQAYQGLDIGTAKPSLEDRAEIPHFLFDIVRPGEVLTAGDYRCMTLPILAQELPKHPVLAVGGSGFYIQALEKGMFEIDKVDPAVEAALRARFTTMTLPAMHEELSKFDPETAEELNPNDSYRIGRALIIFHGLGKKLSQLKRDFKPSPLPYDVVKIGFQLDREKLNQRIRERTRRMLRAGWVEEVKGLLERGLGDWPILQSVGYKQVLQFLRGEWTESQIEDEITLRTLQLAKRQMTWFQRDKEIHWFEGTGDLLAAQRVIEALGKLR